MIIPAVDIRGGRCVRLYQGQPDRETVFGEDPVAMARHWQAQGAQLIHVVDLDGAFSGTPQHLALIADIVASGIAVEFGGGVRTLEAVERLLKLGVRWIVLGTAVLERPELLIEALRLAPTRVAVALDARGQRLAARGWVENSPLTIPEVCRRLNDAGLSRVIYTQIERDGTLGGPDIAGTRRVTEEFEGEVIASGGISTIEDVIAVAGLEQFGVTGMIIGRALYAGTISVRDAMNAIAQSQQSPGGRNA